MAIFDIFSKREQRQSGAKPDVFVYDSIPLTLRVQIVRIIERMIGATNTGSADQIYDLIHETLAHEYGRFHLAKGYLNGEKVFTFIVETQNPEEVVDTVEVAFRFAHRFAHNQHIRIGVKANPFDSAKELNQRFLEAGVGFQFENGKAVRVDSTLIHSEVVKPALLLLSDSRFAGAEQEFLRAHKHYREGNYKECLTECLKAFESTMKTVCEVKNWPYDKGDTAKTLIEVLFQNGLIPPMLQSQFNNLRPLLETGVPVIRNKSGAHGQGPVPADVPAYIAAYAIHLTAANILFIAKAAGC